MIQWAKEYESYPAMSLEHSFPSWVKSKITTVMPPELAALNSIHIKCQSSANVLTKPTVKHPQHIHVLGIIPLARKIGGGDVWIVALNWWVLICQIENRRWYFNVFIPSLVVMLLVSGEKNIMWLLQYAFNGSFNAVSIYVNSFYATVLFHILQYFVLCSFHFFFKDGAFPDAIPFLKWCHRRGIATGVTSNADERYGDSILPMLWVNSNYLFAFQQFHI